MFRLSETDRIKAKSDALRTLTTHSNGVLEDRLPTREKMKGNFGPDVDPMGALISPGCWRESAPKAIKAMQKRCLYIGRMQDIPGHVSPSNGR